MRFPFLRFLSIFHVLCISSIVLIWFLDLSLACSKNGFLLLAVNLNVLGETLYHQRGGKGQARDTWLGQYI